MTHPSTPDRRLSVIDGVAILVGMVVGIGIFTFPAQVAGASGSSGAFLGFWLAGAAISLVGALCYAELASRMPDAGGEYSFLRAAWGDGIGFLFVWARMAVIQTGAIALVAYVFGDYAQSLLPLGPYGSSIYAAIAILAFTAVNLTGTTMGARAQAVLAGLLVLAAAVLAVGALLAGPPADAPPVPASATATTAAGFAMIFVLLTYGGWNEAAYLAGELKDERRSMLRVLVLGIAVVAGLYLLMNLAYLHVLGMGGMAGSKTVAADLARAVFGDTGGTVMAMIVALASLSTLNACIFTGARAAYAAGRDFERLGVLGRWSGGRDTPAMALLVQAGIALVLVLAAALTRKGVQTMVDYTTPVFWLFLLGVALALFRLRGASGPAPFQVPLYPVTPVLFALACVFMLKASLDYNGVGAMFGLLVLGLGIPVMLWVRRPMALAGTRP